MRFLKNSYYFIFITLLNNLCNVHVARVIGVRGCWWSGRFDRRWSAVCIDKVMVPAIAGSEALYIVERGMLKPS